MLTHAACACVAGIGAAAVVLLDQYVWGLPTLLLLALAVVFVAARFVAKRQQRGLRVIEKVAAAADSSPMTASGIREIDETARRVSEFSQRWVEIATESQEQTRQIRVLLAQLDRRTAREAAGRRGSATQQLRQVIAGITDAADADLSQIQQCTEEIVQCTKEIADSAEDQGHAVNKTTNYVEQMSVNIDTVSRNADTARSATQAVHNSSKEILDVVRALKHGMQRVSARMATNERRLRGLDDRAQEIHAIVETIAAVSARTDLLALNASIESIRAGENGRGFSVVAEEVRKLAEQAAEATREATGLIASTQLETKETMSVAVQQRTDVDEQVEHAVRAAEAVERIMQLSDDSADRVNEITQASQHQLRLTHDLVLAVERISNVAKNGRSRAEKAAWTSKTLERSSQQVDTALSPLRRVTDEGGDQNDMMRPVAPPAAAPTPAPSSPPVELDSNKTAFLDAPVLPEALEEVTAG
jgi:methyl-accepting chemotaxis protein